MQHPPPHFTLTPALLIRAYAAGVFPMAEQRDSDEVFWVEPRRRGVLPLDGLHVPRSLAKAVRQDRFTVTVDRCFREVMQACAEPKPGREQTWINESILNAYTALHEKGFAHSVECWREGELVGGLYGVSLGAAFFGESMFSRATDASKVALVHLVARLRVGGFTLLDTQFLTAHLAQFGTVEISRNDYREMLRAALEAEGDFTAIERLEHLSSRVAHPAVKKVRPQNDLEQRSDSIRSEKAPDAYSPLSGKFILQSLSMTL